MKKVMKVALAILTVAILAPVVALSGATDKSPPGLKNFPTAISLKKDNLVIINEEIDGASVAKAIRQLRDLDEKLSNGFLGVTGDKKKPRESKTPINLWLMSPGGSIRAGLELIDAAKGLERPINTITMIAASMAFQIAEALDDRYITQYGTLMSHHAYGGNEGEYGGASPSQFDNRHEWNKELVDSLDKAVVARTGGKQTLESYQKAYENEMYRRGQRAVDEGYADAVVTVKCDNSLNGFETRKALYMGMIPIEYELDNCPLNTAPMNVRLQVQTNKGTMDSDQFTKVGGGFTPQCLVDSATDKNKICALDTSLSQAKLDQIKQEFSSQFVAKQKAPLPLRF